MNHFKMFIGGEFVDALSGKTVETLDPGTGKAFSTVAYGDEREAQAAIDAARTAFDSGVWSGLEPKERSRIMIDFADRLNQSAPKIAMHESLDSGAIINRTKGEVFLLSCMIRNLAKYAADSFPWKEDISIAGNPFFPARNHVYREPMGVCVGIIPWNFPLTMAVWKLAMSLITGNTLVLKPASDTPLSALCVAEVIQQSKIPAGVVNILIGSGGVMGKTLCESPRVDKIAFTGSTEVGKNIMKMGAETIKKVTLELGGKSANVVLEDANIDLAIDGGLFATFFHSGQICESGTRLLVSEKIYDEYLDKLHKRVAEINIGYQLDPRTQMGPIISANQLASIENYVDIGKNEGAHLFYGGERPEGEAFANGFYYKPTIFTEVKNSMRIAQEEIFGPVVCVIPFKDDEEAVAIANDSIYGLGGGIWSMDLARAEKMAAKIKTGTLWINDYHVFGDYCPFGGYKQSGIGRELGHHGLEEYTEVKRVHVAGEGNPQNKRNLQMMFSYGKNQSFRFMGPTKVLAGPGSIGNLSIELFNMKKQRAVIITDSGIKNAGILSQVEPVLGEYLAGVFTEVEADSGLSLVDRAVAYCREVGADSIISLGGGSSIDTAKAVAVTLTQGGKVIENMSILRLNSKQIPHISIPTTAGTGSEVTNVAVILNENIGSKTYVVENAIFPDVAILDPHLTLGLPKGLTASTGMDALTHAIEAVCSRGNNPICDAYGLQAIRLVNEHLPKVIEDGSNLESRLQMQVASTMAGWAFTIAQVGLVHAIAHTVGAKFHVHHGTVCGIFLPHVMRFNSSFCPQQFEKIAKAFDLSPGEITSENAAGLAADAVTDLMRKIDHPLTLQELNVTIDNPQAIAMLTMADAACMSNARPVTGPDQVVELFAVV